MGMRTIGDGLRTSSAPGQDRTRPRKRHGVSMRTPWLPACAPAGRRKPQRANVLRFAVPGSPGRRDRSGGAGSDPAVRGTAAGSGPGAFAHPRPLSLGSLPDQRSLAGRARSAPLQGGGASVRRPSFRWSGGHPRGQSIRRTSPCLSDATGRSIRPCVTLIPNVSVSHPNHRLCFNGAGVFSTRGIGQSR